MSLERLLRGIKRITRSTLAPYILTLMACAGPGGSAPEKMDAGNKEVVCFDNDKDHYFSNCGKEIDCDDDDTQRHPNAEEHCDTIDNNCNGQIDEGLLSIFYEDKDNDSFGNPEKALESCPDKKGLPIGKDNSYVTNNEDCDDNDASINPPAFELCDYLNNNCIDGIDEGYNLGNNCTAGIGACQREGMTYCSTDGLGTSCDAIAGIPVEEVCDGSDNDCNGLTDEAGGSTFYADYDGDGKGDSSIVIESCNLLEGYVGDSTDCNDANAGVWQNLPGYRDEDRDGFGAGAPEIICSGNGLSYGYAADATDCDDRNDEINPAAFESCDGVDNDCNQFSPDGSGERSPLNNLQEGVCIGSHQQCIDGNWIDSYESILFYRSEICDGLDNDCAGGVDNNLTVPSRECSAGIGECQRSGLEFRVCEGVGGWGRYSGCTAVAVEPVTEECNGLDDDCDGEPDNNLTIPSRECSIGFGECTNVGLEYQTCRGIDGWSADYSNCTAVAGIPTEEICDGLDNNCDMLTDNGLVAPSRDCGAGVGECTRSGLEYHICEGINGWSVEYFGCTAVAGEPRAEVCNGLDDDCNRETDSNLTAPSRECSVGIGECRNVGIEYQVCEGSSGWSQNYTGCTAVASTPSDESCNGLDDDCDGIVDEDLTAPSRECSVGIGECLNLGLEYQNCLGRGGWSNEYSDCTAVAGIPTEEICDGLDNNCDQLTDNGLVAPSRDCNAGIGECARGGLEYLTCEGTSGWSAEYSGCTAVAAEPRAEVCNGLDDDCNREIDNGLTAFSRECSAGIGECSRTGLEYQVCGGIDGWSAGYFNCTAVAGNPVTEECNGLDDDCGGVIDNDLTAPSRECSAGVGECLDLGLEYQTCRGVAGWSADYSGCTAVAGVPTEEICDNLDNDCDGRTDEEVCTSLIVFRSRRLEGGVLIGEIHTINPEIGETSRTNISNAPLSNEESPIWSPDGQRIAFTSDREGNRDIYTMDADGRNVTRLTTSADPEYARSWTADGQRVLFERREESLSQIYTANLERIITRISDGTANDFYPSWSPDDTYVAFVGNYSGEDIYRMRPDGTARTPLANGTQNESTPDVSPDGSQILYFDSSTQNAMVMDSNGENKRSLGIYYGLNPKWSPNGVQIVYSFVGSLWVANSDGTGTTQLTFPGEIDDDTEPDW